MRWIISKAYLHIIFLELLYLSGYLTFRALKFNGPVRAAWSVRIRNFWPWRKCSLVFTTARRFFLHNSFDVSWKRICWNRLSHGLVHRCLGAAQHEWFVYLYPYQAQTIYLVKNMAELRRMCKAFVGFLKTVLHSSIQINVWYSSVNLWNDL